MFDFLYGVYICSYSCIRGSLSINIGHSQLLLETTSGEFARRFITQVLYILLCRGAAIPYIQVGVIYCMKPPNIKAPKCTLFSLQYFIFQGQRSQGLTGLATAPSEHRDGQLTSESPFRIVESG